MVDCAAYMPKDCFVEVLSKLRNLTCLTASETGSARQRQLLAALAMPPVGYSKGVVCPHMELLRFSGLDVKPEVVNAIAETYRYRAANDAALKAIHIAGLGVEGVSSLLQAGVFTIKVDDTWVEQVMS